jgi:SAM-dependent methyltransferase
VFVGCSQQRQFGTETQEESTPSVQTRRQAPDVPYVPTPQAVVERMLEIARVNQNDIVYDLGSGDGRILITAAQRYGAGGVGIDINPQRIQEANENAQKAGVTYRVQFRQQDLFETDLGDATVVTLYLLPDVNIQLGPKLLRELKPGSRIVSHSFDMGNWKPQRVEQVDGNTIYLWVVPQKVPENLRS